jgi:hypothetical protein
MKFKGKFSIVLSTLIFSAILLASCQPIVTTEPADSLAQTYAAQTLAAQSTPTPTEETQQEPTQTPTEEPTAAPTLTPTNESSGVCYWASVGSTNESLVLEPDEPFSKTWVIENIGDCTWNTGFQIVFSSGTQMDAPVSRSIPHTVEPGETMEITLNMVAPSEPGIYTGYWLLMADDGDTFGVGQDAETSFWVQVRVTDEDEVLIYSLADNTCDAGWESSVEEDIACPSKEDRQDGFVQPLSQVQMEDGDVYRLPAILAYPDYGRSGYMVGRFPTLEIQEGDHFKAEVGCRFGAEQCNVNFTLRVAMAGEGFDSLGAWWEVYDGELTSLDIDLSDYEGEEVDLTLSVIAATDDMDHYAVWLDPRVVRETDLPDDNCNQARFIEDVTIEDRTLMDAGEEFTKTWRLENVGDCTWTEDYKVVFSSGYQMGAPDSMGPGEEVAPGETINISLDMVAPTEPGVYTGYWMLADEDNNRFGVGEDYDAPFWVRIRVTEEDEFVLYNFAENVCEAGWESSVEEDIECPSDEDFEEGFVQFVDMPRLEDGVTYDEPAILTYPDTGRSGYMVGRYPGFVVEEGDHFRASIGCQYGAENCDVRYTLRIVRNGEGHDRLGMWHEVYEGLYYPVDVDLSDFAGQEVEIVLSVIAVDDTGENYALWLDPRIVRDAD